MTFKKHIVYISAILSLCLLLAGCDSSLPEQSAAPLSFANSDAKLPEDSTSISFAIEADELQLLDGLKQLEYADFSGSECIEEIYNWAKANPQVEVVYTVTMPDGSVMDTSSKSVDLSAMYGEEVRLWADCLRFLPKLKTIQLGSERSGLSWEDIGYLQAACPDANIKYSFKLYDKQIDLQNTQLNLSHADIPDQFDGMPALRQALDHMPNLTYLDMDSCGISNEDMAQLQAEYPHIKVVWRIWFGSAHNYSVRTDVEMILASKPTVGGFIDEVNGADLKYCTEVKYLDLGHNASLRDISFVENMPKLEVAILAMNKVRDISPLAKCPNLEYLEMQTTECTDLSPLSGLKNLRHLNVAFIPNLKDISPLYELSELERLWLGSNNGVPIEQVEEMRRRAPNCNVNIDVYDDPTSGGWRTGMHPEGYMISDPRYILLRLQFNGYQNSSYAFYWNDPLY